MKINILGIKITYNTNKISKWLYKLIKKNYKNKNKNKTVDIYVLTRFNTVVSYKNHDKALDKEYLTERFRLFEKIYLPSLLHQTDENFKILVAFHPDTPQRFKEKLEYYKKISKNRLLVYYNEYFEPEEMIKEAKVLSQSDSEYFIEARLDNDDAFAIDYIEYLRKLFVPINDLFLDFRSGCQYQEEENAFYECYYNWSTHYLVKIHKYNKPFKSVYGINHTLVSKLFKYVFFKTTNPMWVETCHNCNAENQLSVDGKIMNREDMLERFNVGKTLER